MATSKIIILKYDASSFWAKRPPSRPPIIDPIATEIATCQTTNPEKTNIKAAMAFPVPEPKFFRPFAC